MAGRKSIGTSLVLLKENDETEDLVLAHLTSIGEQTTTADELDVTTLDSPNRSKEYEQGSKDPGTIAVAANNCLDGQVAKLRSVFNSGAVRKWKEVYPDNGATLEYEGYISEFTYGEATVEGLLTSSFSIRLSGEPEYEEPGA